jgi:hypothetical protein
MKYYHERKDAKAKAISVPLRLERFVLAESDALGTIWLTKLKIE